MSSECCICLSGDEDGGPSSSFMAFPGCGHRMHALCALKLARCGDASLRCPMCRHEALPAREPAGADEASELSSEDSEALRNELREAFRRQRLSAQRRRRFIHSRPELLEKWRRLKTLRREMNEHLRCAQRSYEQKCRDMYRCDPDICRYRAELANMRRRERRLERIIDRAVETSGPEESFYI